MANYNKVILVGNLTRDPEIKYTAGGTSVATFGLAVNRRYKQGEELKEETLFVDVVVFGKQAETAGEYLHKGSPVLIEGRLSYRTWEKDGQKRSKHEVVAEAFQFLGGPTRDSDRSQSQGDTAPVKEDDIPF